MTDMSLRETLEAAAKGEDAPVEAVAPAAAPEPVVEAAPAAGAPAEAPEAKAAPEGRDEKGRFAPKEPKAEASADAPLAEPKPIETAPPAEPEPQATEAIRIPPSLPAAVKAQWSELKPEVQQAFHKLEETVQTAKAEWGRKGERLNRYDEIMAPRSEKLQLQGIDEFTAIKTLFAAQDFLERDPLGGLSYLARSYGVNLQSLGQQPTGQAPSAEAPPSPTADPAFQAALRPVLQQVQTLQQQLAHSAQSTEAEKLASAQAEVAAFASRPENMYFENVRNDVAKRIESGAATTLADAYDQAIWASPEIRPLLLRAQTQDAARKDAEAAQRQKAAAARQSAGSVTGAPSPGAVAPSGPVGSVRDSLKASMEQLGAV